MDLKVGYVLEWKDFPFPLYHTEEIKTRWLVFVGRTSIVENEAYCFLVAGTSHLQPYLAGGNRSNHNFVRIPAGMANLPKETIFDITGSFYSNILANTLESYKNQIRIAGELPTDQLRQLYNLILKENTISKKIKKDIQESYNRCGITGLKSP